ncbi:MAG: GGDEF domain-containing phosphodiesterase, partial [Pseudomonadota bacterium]
MQRLAEAEAARAAIEERLRLDSETGLPNEGRMLEYIADALEVPSGATKSTSVGLLIVEMMEHRQLVDLYGAVTGRRAIRALAEALEQGLGPGDVLGRLNEQEFAILVPEVSSRRALVHKAEKLSRGLGIELKTDMGAAHVSSLIAMAEMPAGEGGAEQLLTNTRIALGFRDLQRRPGQIRAYESEMRSALEARSRTYNELFAALDNDEIEPFFQPQVRLEDRSVVGFEVLVRWRHPEQGLVPPGLFLEIAEETGLLPRIDDIVMQKAMACLGEWHRNGFPESRISLNCTGEALRDPDFVDRLMVEIDKNGLEPRHVALEILETVLFGGEQDAARITLKRLQELGFYLEIDDFGTGQASISHLITLNADAVKLDRSLVRDIVEDKASRMVVEATVALSSNLGLTTLAEGAEDEEQMALLLSLGCELVQGFGIARPMPFEDTTKWLRAHGEGTGAAADPKSPPSTAIAS